MIASRSFEFLSRMGYASRGAVYAVLAVVALTSIFSGMAQDSSSGVLSSLLSQPFGRVMLGLIAIGLFGYVLWRLAQSVLNADGRDGEVKDYVARAALFVSAVSHAGLAVYAGRLALGMGAASSGGSSEESGAAWLMQQPFGPWLVGAVGLAFIATGGVQIFRGLTARYCKWVRLPQAGRKLLMAVCGFGLSARGVLFIITGGFFLYAALSVDPEDAASLPEALDWVRQLPYGLVLYVLAALGLLAFAGYSLIEARYRRVDAPDGDDVKHAMPFAGR